MRTIKKDKVPEILGIGEIFDLEDNIEIPNTRGDIMFVNKIKNTLNVIKIGQSFIIPRPKHWRVNKLAKTDEYTHMRLASGLILPDKKFVRIKRVL